MTKAIWPVHRRGALWSFALLQVASGYAFIPLEVTASRCLGIATGVVVAIAVATGLNELGLLPEWWSTGADLFVFFVAMALGDRLGHREAIRKLRRMVADPDRYVRKRGAFVLPARTRLVETSSTRRSAKAVVEWWDPRAGPRRATLHLPAKSLDDFRGLWLAPAARP